MVAPSASLDGATNQRTTQNFKAGDIVIVCHCEVVNDRAIVDSIIKGARTLEGVCKTIGAGKNCGACIFTLKRLLCEHGAVVDTPMPEVERAAS